MTDALACTLFSYKSVPTRKVFQAVVELPIEQASQAIALFGQPDPDGATWLALARLARVPGKAAAAEPASEKPKLRSNLAAILCKENAEFHVWLAKRYPQTWDRFYYTEPGEPSDSAHAADRTLKNVLGIQSKTDLDKDDAAAERFDRLTTDFAYRNVTR